MTNSLETSSSRPGFGVAVSRQLGRSRSLTEISLPIVPQRAHCRTIAGLDAVRFAWNPMLHWTLYLGVAALIGSAILIVW